MILRQAARLLVCCVCFSAASARATEPPGFHVGTLTLTKCIAKYNGYCGALERPLDPERHVKGTIGIGFEYYPRTDRGSERVGVIVAQEGGPGYSTTSSRDGYVRLFAPLRNHRDILLIDKRGTGRSEAIDCGRIQRIGGIDAVRACGRKLGGRAWLYGSTFAADDIAAVLAALQTGRVDYYGDSYGTFFGEIFASRHSDLLRTVVLDSAYPVIGSSPFFPTEIENGPDAFARVCGRSPSCKALGSDAKVRFDSLLQSLRSRPVSGAAPDASGKMRRVTANAAALFTIVADAGNNFTAYRDIDAAGRALRDSGDALPLLRLVAEAIDGEETAGPPQDFSVGLELAVQCADYPQLYDMHSREADRRMQDEASLAATGNDSPRLYAPFRLDEAVRAPANPEAFGLCEAWPQAPHWAKPGMPLSGDAKFPHVPVLVLAGELDTVTSPEEGRATAALFPDATYVEVPNTVHETAIGNGGVHVPPFGGDLARCAGPIVIAFIDSGGRPPDTSCLAKIRPVRPVPRFAKVWRDAAPADAQSGNQADTKGLKLASAAAETVGDAVARYGLLTGKIGRGLRGGSFALSPTKTGYAFDMNALRWTDDLAISGITEWDQLTGRIVANITLSAPHHTGTLRISWNDRDTDAEASIAGQIDDHAVVATRVAP